MKKTMRLIGIAAVVAVMVFAFAACANEPSDKAQTMTYSGSDGGTPYTLTITQDPSNRAFTPKTGDAYTLSSGGKVSSGTVKNYSASAVELIAATGSTEFTVNISSAGITGFTGASSLNWDDGTPASLPSSVTPGKGNTAVTFSGVNANGNTSQTTTQLTLTFSAAVTGLSASDITLSGISGVTKGTLTGSGPAYTLSVSGFTAGGTLTVAVAKTGYNISGSPKQTTIYYSSTNNPEPSEPTPDLYYVLINNDTEYSVSVGMVTSGAVVIPAEYNGKAVTSIGNGAFNGCTGLTSITIPGSVTSIGNSAFRGCTGLTSVTIPGSVTSIGNQAFQNCSGLTSITIPDSVTSIGDSAFSGCKNLTGALTIPEGVTSIGNQAFQNCSGLTSITIPDSITSIGYRAFQGCTGIESITIPNNIISINSFLFADCSSLESLTIAEGITGISNNAFENCTSLTSLTIPESVTFIYSHVFEGCSDLTSVTFNGVIDSSIFGVQSFDGDLRDKYLAGGGGIGTYTRTAGGEVWTKQP